MVVRRIFQPQSFSSTPYTTPFRSERTENRFVLKITKNALKNMQMLFRIELSSRILFILILFIAKIEEHVARRINNSAIEEEIAPVKDETYGFDFFKGVSIFRTSIPIYECITTQSILRCMKIYVLQKMESHKQNPRTGNLTRDFLDQFMTRETDMANLVSDPYTKMSDQELSKRLVVSFQQFFKNSDIKLEFLPGIIFKIIPSKDNKLKFSFKKQLKRTEKFTGRSTKTNDEINDNASIETAVNSLDSPVGEAKLPGNLKKRKNKKEGNSYKQAIIQMAVPVMVMPTILLGSILPFLLPVLKMATIMTIVLNNSAFIAALIYAARTHANAQEEQHISYGSHPIYH